MHIGHIVAKHCDHAVVQLRKAWIFVSKNRKFDAFLVVYTIIVACLFTNLCQFFVLLSVNIFIA